MTTVLVHGNPETSAIWGPLISALADQGINDVTTLSPPGFGAPTPDGWDAQASTYVAWLAEELAKLEGPIDLLGHDWGAGHVFGLLGSEPQLVRSWACDCAGLIHPNYIWHDRAQVWQTPGEGEAAIAAMTALPTEERQIMYEGLGMSPSIAAELAQAAANPEMGRCILGLYRSGAQPALAKLGQRLFEADLPTGLVIDATGDAYVGSDLAAEVIPKLNAQHLELADEGHWWMISAPEKAAAGLASFWKSID
jgi:pimeloyl-ACP methyl ester carboxylesterase